MDVLKELQELVGCKIVGVADAASYDARAPKGHGARDFFPEARTVIVAGFLREECGGMGESFSVEEEIAAYRRSCQFMRERLSQTAAILQRMGARVYPLPYREMPRFILERRREASLRALRSLLSRPGIQRQADRLMWDRLSYSHLAVEAGLGELGLNGLLLTPEMGPRVRLMAIVSDMELKPGERTKPWLCQPDLCGYACARACPSGAIPRVGKGVDKIACLKHHLQLLVSGDEGLSCGLCMVKCPVVRTRFRAEAEKRK